VKKETLSALFDKIKHPLRPRIEPRIDSASWDKLAQERMAEANRRSLPPRFFHSTSSGRYDFTIQEKGDYVLIIYDSYVNTNSENGMNEAVVLAVGSEPKYAYGFPTEVPSEKFWVVSDIGEDLEEIGLAFHHLQRAKLFDSRQNKGSWRGLYPDADGLIKSLDEEEAISGSLRNIPANLMNTQEGEK